jgi:Glycosyltransferase family 10 (fucosyltransferase) C-term
MHPSSPIIRVKLLTKNPKADVSDSWVRFLPGENPVLGGCHFLFDRNERNYDWLVVYDDMPSVGGERFTLWKEELACSPANTLLITTEPSTIKVYGSGFLRQFNHVLTSQEPWAIRHPGAIFSQTGLIWFYGGETHHANYDYIAGHSPDVKQRDISTVCSSKRQRHTLHHARFEFTRKFKDVYPDLDVFGHGVRFIADKSDALDPYRYHIAIENHVYKHHWTEKLADSFLGLTLPFYHGCPNVGDYFPEESFIPVNIHRFEEASERIKQAIKDREFEKRLPALREARRLVLEEYSTFPLLARLICERHETKAEADRGGIIMSRHAWRKSSKLRALAFGVEKASIFLRHAIT